MAEVRWALQAADDLETIIDYIARDSEHYASLFAINIVEVIELLVVSPKRGRVVPEVRKENIRETFFGNYRIIYRLRSNLVEILTIYHGSRLLDPGSLGLAD